MDTHFSQDILSVEFISLNNYFNVVFISLKKYFSVMFISLSGFFQYYYSLSSMARL